MSETSLPSARAITELAHELRAPLGGIEAMAEMLTATALSEEQGRMVTALQASALHLRQIADRVLGNDRATLDDPAMSLSTLLQQIECSAQARAAVKGVRFALRGADAVRNEHLARPSGFRQVIENLLDNALRLSLGGEVVLDIRKAGERISVEVLDEGPGLSQADAARLIAEGGAITGRAGGAGIGLSISGRLVARHGGKLEGGPRETGPGARFVFDWPLEKRVTGQGRTCLILDDHPASRLVLRTILAAFGMECTEVACILEARGLLESRRFAVLFTDLRLGDEDGRTLIAELGAMPAAQKPQIVVVSADRVEPDDPVAALVEGQILKPLSVQAIADCLNALAPRESAVVSSQAA